MVTQKKKENNEDLTIEKVKRFKYFENISDAEASNIVFSLKQFSLIAYDYYKKSKKELIDST